MHNRELELLPEWERNLQYSDGRQSGETIYGQAYSSDVNSYLLQSGNNYYNGNCAPIGSVGYYFCPFWGITIGQPLPRQRCTPTLHGPASRWPLSTVG
jgi:hypothetical protein